MNYIYDTPEAINEWTDRAKLHIKCLLEVLENYKKDGHKESRVKSQECKYCYYFRSNIIAGQAFTKYECGICKEIHTHPNTAVPKICKECAKKHNICTRCCADLNLKKRKTNVSK